MKRKLLLCLSAIIAVGLNAQALLDSHYGTIGHIKSDGIILDSHYSTIGHIKDDGTVQDEHYSTIGHASGIPKTWAALYFFFFAK